MFWTNQVLLVRWKNYHMLLSLIINKYNFFTSILMYMLNVYFKYHNRSSRINSNINYPQTKQPVVIFNLLLHSRVRNWLQYLICLVSIYTSMYGLFAIIIWVVIFLTMETETWRGGVSSFKFPICWSVGVMIWIWFLFNWLFFAQVNMLVKYILVKYIWEIYRHLTIGISLSYPI